MVRAEPQLGAWWSVMESARHLVFSRLRSPFGGPAQTFEGLDRMLTSALPSEGAKGDAAALERLRLILHALEHLERQIHNACDGSIALPSAPKSSRVFFMNNRRVCHEWLARIRPKLISAAIACRQPASVVRHAQMRLIDLCHRGNSLCTRSTRSLSGSGRLYSMTSQMNNEESSSHSRRAPTERRSQVSKTLNSS